MRDEIKIGKRIRECREKAGLTQEELGSSLGLNKSTIQRYEVGKVTRIKLPVLEAIAYELGVSPEYLALQTDDPIDYENSDEVKNAPLDIIEHFNGNAQKIYAFQKSVELDAASATAICDLSHEQEHLKKYRALDDYGRDMVDTVLDKEYERCKQTQCSAIIPTAIAAQGGGINTEISPENEKAVLSKLEELDKNERKNDLGL